MTKQFQHPTRAEGIERLRTLYAVLAGITEGYLRLRSWIDIEHPDAGVPTARKVLNNCGSAACAMGWASLYPPFRALGLTAGIDEKPQIKGVDTDTPFDVARMFFALGETEASLLFGSRDAIFATGTALHTFCYKGLLPDATDKRVALHRIRRFLEYREIITPTRSAELAEIEKGY